MRAYGTLSRELSCSKSHSSSRWRCRAGGSSRLRAERLACASHCTPLLSRRSSSSVVRASLAQSATSIAALARCQGSPLARLTAWMDGAARPPVNADASSSTALPLALYHSFAKLTQRAPVRARERLRVGQRKGLGMISCVERTSLHFCSDAAAARVANARMQPSGASHRLCEAYCQRLAGRSFPDAHVAFHDVFFRGEPSARCGR